MTTEADERAKYERVWQNEQYRRQSPGEPLVDDALIALGAKAGDTVVDFGCGTGRPAQRIQAHGFNVTGVDFAGNCLDSGIAVPFLQATLWDLPSMSADWGFCTDVMEHIPPDRVDAVLAGIRRSVRGAFFQIATRPDVMGKLVGEKLHLTVQPASWWSDKLAQYWDKVEMMEGSGWMQAIVR